MFNDSLGLMGLRALIVLMAMVYYSEETQSKARELKRLTQRGLEGPDTTSKALPSQGCTEHASSFSYELRQCV